jgi:hypothetical protein
MLGERDISLGRVVFHEDGRQVDAGSPPQDPAHLVCLLGALEDDGVNAVRVQLRQRHLPH